MTDEIGVLSIYVTLDPHELAEMKAKPAAEVRLRNELARLREDVKTHRSREHSKAAHARLEALRPQVEWLVDPGTPGLGRALFAGVASGEVRTVSVQVPLVERVVLESQAHLRPLVTAWSIAGSAGAVSVSADAVRVVDLRLGLAEDIVTIPYENPVEQRELKGPAAANPALAQRAPAQRDLFERREDDKRIRFLRTVGPRLAGFASERGWDQLAVTGDATLVQAVTDGLPATAGVVTLEHPVNSLSAPKLASTVQPALTDARERHHRALAEHARDAALSANAGAYGLGETLTALQEGRVAHLLLAADGQWRGSRTPDGMLVPAGEVPPGTDQRELSDEPYLDERMIELAFREGAEITMLTAAAAAPLAEAAGIGAILRW